jgi:hypothetical protein
MTTGNYDAEFAQAGGSVIQVDTKSGTNEIHGAALSSCRIMCSRARFVQPRTS